MTARVTLQNITKSFGDNTALSDISLDIQAGEFIVLLGPSGCGKSTLLSIIGGFLSPTAGNVLIGDRDMTTTPPSNRPTTTMFQDYALFPHMTLQENVAFGLRMRGFGRKDRRRKAESFLDMVGLKASADRKPHELSGGQRQRVALARALAVAPDLLLLDEPLGALDMKLRREMQDELKAIQKDVGTTFIHVTHDQEEAMAIADRIAVMNHGVIEDFGKPTDIYMRPRSVFTAGFMGEVNFIPGNIIAGDEMKYRVETVFGFIELPINSFTTGAPNAGDEMMLCIRPEHFRPISDGIDRKTLCRAQVVDSAFFGTHFRCHLIADTAPDNMLIAHIPQSAQPTEGDVIEVLVNPADIIAVPAKTLGN
jgi:spermidine/putrescine transport system ATP-binding protein